MKITIPQNSLFLAPMEGVTGPLYRQLIEELFPFWDFMACDFLRAPQQGKYKDKHIVSHYGESIWKNKKKRAKTFYQILTSSDANIEALAQSITKLKFPWVDLNLGCPSRTVNKHYGGSYLLQDLKKLDLVLTKLRQSFKGFLSAKIRVGYHDDHHFFEILKLLEENKIEMITIHGRTRDQMYKGRANWDYIAQAVENTTIPIIGNGDVWSASDIKNILEYTGCRGVMMARGALKSPWLAMEYKNPEQDWGLARKFQLLKNYFFQYERLLSYSGLSQEIILKNFKNLSRYPFEHFPNGDLTKSKLLRSQSLKDYKFELLRAESDLLLNPILKKDFFSKGIPVK